MFAGSFIVELCWEVAKIIKSLQSPLARKDKFKKLRIALNVLYIVRKAMDLAILCLFERFLIKRS